LMADALIQAGLLLMTGGNIAAFVAWAGCQ
jgi:hypothetical protein